MTKAMHYIHGEVFPILWQECSTNLQRLMRFPDISYRRLFASIRPTVCLLLEVARYKAGISQPKE